MKTNLYLVATSLSLAINVFVAGAAAAPPSVPLKTLSELISAVVVDPVPATGCGSNAYACLKLQVTCGGQNTRGAVLKLSRAAASTDKAWALFINGGSGTTFWENASSYARDALIELNNTGINTAQLKWDTSWNKAQSNEALGLANQACRAAAVAAYLQNYYVQPFSGRAFCVSGNSGGSTQISYMLSHYGLESLVDLAVPTSGPPQGRLDYGCVSDTLDEYAYDSAGVTAMDAAYGGLTTCTQAKQGNSASRETLRNDSVAYGGDYNYPNTDVAFIYGTGDLTNSVAQGMAYVSALMQSQHGKVTVEVLPGIEHTIHNTSIGATAVKNVFLNRCVIN